MVDMLGSLYRRCVQDILEDNSEWIPSRVLHWSRHLGNTGLVRHDLQGLSTKYPISKSNR
jgi:hypothetical protein